jgi:sterol desaturase/sphingolipid hydroxylase (fatty acid hydroxylase superfamily)
MLNNDISRHLYTTENMPLFTLEHSKTAYRADFVLYLAAVVGLATYLMVAGPKDHQFQLFAIALAGLAAWTFIEYALHRFVLHGLPPFKHWHAAHHERPRALICTPTLLSATLICALVFLPALFLGGTWRACALTTGLLMGYLVYTLTHHATHHWRASSAWLQRRKHWHALHHHVGQSGHYGVTSAFWDHVFCSLGTVDLDPLTA